MSSVAYTTAAVLPGISTRGSMASSAVGGSNTGAKGKRGPGKAPFRHIDDLVSVTVDLDPHTPLRKMLELGDAHMRQATTFNDFGRPDLALQEYIKAFTIAVDKVPRHKDYPSMKSDRGDLSRLYNALKLKITSNGAVFDNIKEYIKRDNLVSGVKPTSSGRSSISSNITQQTQSSISTTTPQAQTQDGPSISSAGANTSEAGPGLRQKPAVQPKPKALHGKAIAQPQKPPPQDLADRFARLRDPKKPQPASPGESSPGKSLPSLDTSIVTMPKVPQAIYNPARGTVTSELANLPSSSPRGMFSRANSMTIIPSAPTRTLSDNAVSREQFVAANTYGASQPWRPFPKHRIPTEDVITATTLANLLDQQSGVDILLIDVRSREYFDEGHIKSNRTICVEPAVLMRENISADEIVDSMILAPATEKLAIEQRDKVDLVVIYNDSSSSIPTRVTGSASEMVLYNIRQALSYYSYGRPLKDRPKLLSGGLDAWVDKFGEQFLETSNTQLDHVPRRQYSSGYGDRRRAQKKIRTLSSDEVKEFEDLIHQEEDGAFDYVKTREDFIRRYPSITVAPESMTSPALQRYQKSGRPLDPQEEDYLAGIGPAPPARPAPAMPRTRYSGLESTDDDSSVGALAKMAPATTRSSPVQFLTGLEQASNSCFANSTMQALLASPMLIDEFLSTSFPRNWRFLPDDSREPTQPQLLAKILANTFQWMSKKQFRSLRLGTLMHYLRAVHPGYTVGNSHFRLGDGNQHDSDEFMNFLTTQLGAETSIRNLVPEKPPVAYTDADNATVRRLVDLFWEYQKGSASLISKHLISFSGRERVCDHCQRSATQPESRSVMYLSPAKKSNDVLGLMRQNHVTEVSDFRDVDGCGQVAGITITERFLRFPPVLCINLRRVQQEIGQLNKTSFPCTIPEDLDLSPFSYDSAIRQRVSDIIGAPFNEGISTSTQYSLYAVQVHQGPTMNSGHYWTLVRQKATAPKCWLKCDDDLITQRGNWSRELDNLSRCVNPSETPVQLYYRRVDVPYENYLSNIGPGLPTDS
ncbi:cysteine proteinase [Hypoxylon sp. FL1284]|nr:cysteine proteinase [Hypoxylon sp. FL1284]